jgi:hypothetical protein
MMSIQVLNDFTDMAEPGVQALFSGEVLEILCSKLARYLICPLFSKIHTKKLLRTIILCSIASLSVASCISQPI